MSSPPAAETTREQLREYRRVRRSSEPVDVSEYHTVVILALSIAACIIAATTMQEIAPTYFGAFLQPSDA